VNNTVKPVTEMTTDELVDFLEIANNAYRKGEPIITDETYDQVYFAELKKREPEHAFLQAVEPEQEKGVKVRHLVPMLSTDKAYTQEETNTFINRVVKSAETLGISKSEIKFRITPKLDGMAANYFDGVMATRGNGLMGNDISRNLKRGLIAVGGENTGVGEIVMVKSYFDENLSDKFSHPRNFVTGLIGADTLSEQAKEALQDAVIHFVPYTHLEALECGCDELSSRVEEICHEAEDKCIYPVDGSVIDVVNSEIRADMGATSHHNNWQLAKKTKGETASAVVEGITWQTGRTGRITPVINIQTVNLSGADISNVTGHNAGNILNLNVGIGAEIEIVRSGEVIPKLLGVVKEGEQVVIPNECPACKGTAKMEKDFLVCQSDICSAQLEARLLHFFNVLGNVDLFGPRTIQVLVENGITDIESVYQVTAEQFELMGFGKKQSSNLIDQLQRSRTEIVEDWRLLAAFGIPHLGRGDSRKLLKVYPLNDLHTLSVEQFIAIPGFGEITAKSIHQTLIQRWDAISAIISLGFTLHSDDLEVIEDSVITGKNVVFTGAMNSSRDDMKENARKFGANVQSSVNKKTDILVIGDKVGAKKIEKAEALGTKILTEAEYIELIK
jgi:DNA ligase (NAD+)